MSEKEQKHANSRLLRRHITSVFRTCSSSILFSHIVNLFKLSPEHDATQLQIYQLYVKPRHDEYSLF